LEQHPSQPVQELDEHELARRCQREDRSAQEALYARYARRMFAVCLRYARHRPEAEDLLQEGFIRVFDKLEAFRMEGSLEGWIRRIMVHTCINHLRRPSVRNEVLGADIALVGATKPVALGNLGQQELLRLVQLLPDGYRAVFNLYAVEGYDHAEIAAMLGINEGTSRSQLAKARRQLQRGIEDLNAKRKHERAAPHR
jgi:RNA polymerase sigma-70 factor (ECF subfamily)